MTGYCIQKDEWQRLKAAVRTNPGGGLYSIKGQFWVCHILLIDRVSGVAARPRPPRGALSAKIVSTASAPDGDGRRESVCAGRRGGGRVAEQWGGRWRLVRSQVRGDRSCVIGTKSDTLIRMVALTNMDFPAGNG